MVTSKDVAKEANVSHMTVSRAFQPNSSIKEETRKKVLEVAKRLNYIPNYKAKSLVMNRNFSVGLFFSSMEGTSEIFLGDLVSQIYQLLPHNYLLAVNSVDRINLATEDYMIQSIIRRFDGIIIVTQSEKDDSFIDYLHKSEIPTVVMNRLVTQDIYNVSADESVGIKELVTYLAKCKITTVGTIKGFPGFYSSGNRYHEFLKACEQAGIKMIDTAIEAGEYTISSGYEAMKSILHKNKSLPEMIFCENDNMAIGAIKACGEYAIQVPQHLSIVGFDDTNYARYANPGLTTIHKPYNEMAKISMEILLKLMAGERPEKRNYHIDSRLVIRESVKRRTN